jgi:Type II secretion system (T2SS), protein M
VTLTDRDRKIMIALVPVLVLVAYWFLLLAPKREEAKTAKDELATAQTRLDTARQAVQSAQGAKQNFDASYAQIVRLGKAIPSTVDMPSLLVQLDAAAAGTGIKFTKIATGDRVASTTTTPAATTTPPAAGSTSGTTGTPAAAGGETAQSQPGAAAETANNAQQTANQRNTAAENSGVAASDTQTSTTNGGGLPVGGGTAATGTDGSAATAPPGLETIPLELEFQGDFFNLTDFFHSIKRFVTVANGSVAVSGRLLTVEGVRWSSDETLFPKIKAEITATIYLSPKAQGVTAGATPQGPATGTPADGTTPAQNTPAVAPTATATP